MTAMPKPIPTPQGEPAAEPPELRSGDHMTREEFHRVYEQMPVHFRAELVEGVVYVASPLRIQHGNRHGRLVSLVFHYEGHTPGVEAGDNTTILLGPRGEPQPDVYLRILPEHGGQSRTTADDYPQGAPELVIEVAHSSRAIDMHAKKGDYARHGVREYVVWTVADDRLHWFDLATGHELSADTDGVMRLRTFPGLWIDTPALVVKDYKKLLVTLHQGLATPEHAAFVQRLARAKSG